MKDCTSEQLVELFYIIKHGNGVTRASGRAKDSRRWNALHHAVRSPHITIILPLLMAESVLDPLWNVPLNTNQAIPFELCSFGLPTFEDATLRLRIDAVLQRLFAVRDTKPHWIASKAINAARSSFFNRVSCCR